MASIIFPTINVPRILWKERIAKIIDVLWEYEYLKLQVNNTDEGGCVIGSYNNVIEAYSWKDYVLSP